jgi:ABC-type multidrug transport system ATPase subunit
LLTEIHSIAVFSAKRDMVRCISVVREVFSNQPTVQQQDLHLETSTVRESLRFSAVLRQPKSVSKKEKYEYVENVIQMLGMQDFAEAIVGVPGQGLNVEQRKLLTIGVELAARPKLRE